MRKYSWKTPNYNDDIKKVCSKQTTATHSRKKQRGIHCIIKSCWREKKHTHSTLNSFKWQVEKNKGSVNNLLFSTTHIRFIVSDLAPRHSMQFYFAQTNAITFACSLIHFVHIKLLLSSTNLNLFDLNQLNNGFSLKIPLRYKSKIELIHRSNLIQKQKLLYMIFQFCNYNKSVLRSQSQF